MPLFSVIPKTANQWRWLVLRLVFLIVLPVSSLLWYMIDMPQQSYKGPLLPATEEEKLIAARMSGHVRAVAGKEHNTQAPVALEAAARYLESQLAGMGYVVARQVFESGYGQVRNLEVEIKGSVSPSEIVIVGAHYDSAPGAPGANDNGSGTAMTLELARLYRHLHPGKTIRFVFFVNEESPYFSTTAMGSRYYADRARARYENIIAMLSLETLGYYDDAAGSQHYPMIFRPFFPSSGNFIAFVGDLRSRALVRQAIASFRSAAKFPSEGIATFSWIKGIDWSDHWSFWKNDYRALMITDTALFRYPHYHTGQDMPERLDYLKMAKVLGGIRAVIDDLAGRTSTSSPTEKIGKAS